MIERWSPEIERTVTDGSDIRERVRGLYRNSTDAQASVNKQRALSYGSYEGNSSLRRPKPQKIRAGKAGGLAFDSLTSDLYLGCLPGSQVCYGNCFAARAAFEAGIDFGQRVANILDEDLFLSDLEKLPEGQGYLKNGWNSDPSWNWEMAVRVARLVRGARRHFLLLTKYFTRLDAKTAATLVELGVELRVSISTFDSSPQLAHRLRALVDYRQRGGVAVAQLYTTVFKDSALNDRQKGIVDYLIELDIPTGENSLRIDRNSPVMNLIEKDACRQILGTRDFWCGRLYQHHLPIPPITALPNLYRGLQSSRLSKNDATFVANLWSEKIPTQDEILRQGNLGRPSQCGVPLDWNAIDVRGAAVEKARKIPTRGANCGPAAMALSPIKDSPECRTTPKA